MANPNPKTDHLKPWQPGQSGNPDGPKRTKPLTEALVKHLAEGDNARKLVEAMVKHAKAGDPRFMQMILDRLEGRILTVEQEQDQEPPWVPPIKVIQIVQPPQKP
jgi:hypothetical protein